MKLIHIILIVATLILVACQPVQQTTVNTAPGTVKEVQIPEGKGRAVLTLTSHGNYPGITSVRMTVDSVELFSAADGWVTINGDENSYDLLKLQNEQGLLGDKVIDAGSYSQVRMKISSVQLTDASGDHNVKLPTENLIINAAVPIKAGGASAVTFDFLIDQGVRKTQTGDYVMLPVVHLTTQEDATVNLLANNGVVITTGAMVSDVTLGTSIAGTTAVDIRVPPTTIIVVQNDRIIETNTVVNNTVTTNTVINNTVMGNVTNTTVTTNRTNSTTTTTV